ncbi:hypothetical protein L950_0220885 [Sphingobacterium sp. IITKGP-BTPF85]|nr:hypothetical protein L950_0220885 [Sphingobacterium sp. IITKGP-BTPF85]
MLSPGAFFTLQNKYSIVLLNIRSGFYTFMETENKYAIFHFFICRYAAIQHWNICTEKTGVL